MLRVIAAKQPTGGGGALERLKTILDRVTDAATLRQLAEELLICATDRRRVRLRATGHRERYGGAMTTSYLLLTAHDPIVARDGRPFGVGQGYRMKGLDWPYPSVIAGSLRTALVKASPGRDFGGRHAPGRAAEDCCCRNFPRYRYQWFACTCQPRTIVW